MNLTGVRAPLGLGLRVLILLVVLAITTGSVLVFSGMGWSESMLAAFVLLCEGVFGAAVWAALRHGWTVAPLEVLAAGIVVGVLAFVGIDQALVVLGQTAWRMPVIVMAGVAGSTFLLLSRHCDGLTGFDNAWGDVALLLGSMGAAGGYLVDFWRRFPLLWSAGGSYGTDTAFHEAVANSVSTIGPGGNFMALGHRTSYHWFSHAWAGSTAAIAEAQPFAILSRFVPLVSITLTLILIIVMVRAWSGRRVVALLACGAVLIQGSQAASAVFTPLSPPQLFVLPVMLLAAWTFWLFTEDRMFGATVFLPLLAFACVMAKVNALIIIAGLVVAVFVRLIRGQARWPEVATVGASVVLAVGSIAFEAEEQGKNGLSLSWTQTAEYLRLDLPTFHGSTVVSLILVVAVLVSPWLGVVLLMVDGRTRWSTQVWLVAGTGASAVALATNLAQSGRSQLNFVITASSLLIPVAVWGIYVGWARIGASRTRSLVPLCCILIGGAIVGVSPCPMTLALVSVTSLVLLASAVLWGAQSSRKGMLVALGSVVLALAASSTFAFTQTVLVWMQPLPSEASLARSRTNSVTGDQREATMWLRNNVPASATVATNRFCDDISAQPPECRSVQFDVSSAGKHQTLIEGYTYTAGEGPLPAWAARWVTLSLDFAAHPSPASLRGLAREDVTWLYVDKRLPHASSWEPWGIVRFENDGAAVVELTAG